MFAAVWINKFAHAQRHREPLAESRKDLANDAKESDHWEPVLNKNRFSIPIPSLERLRCSGWVSGWDQLNQPDVDLNFPDPSL